MHLAVCTSISLGMLLTAIAAYVTVNTALINLAANPIVLLVAVVAEFGLVLGISFGFNKISSGTAGVLFFAYAALKLYLDFINMFLFMLRLTGRRR